MNAASINRFLGLTMVVSMVSVVWHYLGGWVALGAWLYIIVYGRLVVLNCLEVAGEK